MESEAIIYYKCTSCCECFTAEETFFIHTRMWHCKLLVSEGHDCAAMEDSIPDEEATVDSYALNADAEMQRDLMASCRGLPAPKEKTKNSNSKGNDADPVKPIITDVIIKQECSLDAVTESHDSDSDIGYKEPDCLEFDAQPDTAPNSTSSGPERTSFNYTQATLTKPANFNQANARYDVEHHLREDEEALMAQLLNISAFNDNEQSVSRNQVLRRRPPGVPQQCKWCKKLFSTKSSLKRHELVHNGKRPYQCKLCHKRFQYPWVLKRHGIVHGFNESHRKYLQL